MATTAVIVKVMPSGLETDIKEIETSAKKILEAKGAKNISIEEQEIAFGLKAIMLKFAWPEENGTDFIEESLSKIKDVSSVTIEDYRRAFG